MNMKEFAELRKLMIEDPDAFREKMKEAGILSADGKLNEKYDPFAKLRQKKSE